MPPHNEPMGVHGLVGIAGVMGKVVVKVSSAEKDSVCKLDAGDILVMEDRAPWKWSIEPGEGSGRKVVAVLTAVNDYMMVARERMKRWAPQHQEAKQLQQGGSLRATNKSRMQTKRARENDEGVQDKAGEVEWYGMSKDALNRKLDRVGVAPTRI